MIARGFIGSLFQRSATAAEQGIGPLKSAEGRAQGQERQRGKIFNTKCINNRFRGAGYWLPLQSAEVREQGQERHQG
ncbi:hypothetical protein G114_06777 [Aeromonas diversa CDC 2478-85]|uniref:Uncharacterized protein n=1 Tax=Aeromonas diversa CDC 2478-85 TaxID=1268237 RepID=N9VM02_9GAMM|nr:hypothetical protein G114_06777 [Aeromonas diversa CDC 2478-85]